MLLIFITGAWNLASGRKISPPVSLLAVLALWSGMFIWGLLRSPYLGAAVPLCSDALIYGAVLLCGFFIGQAPSRRSFPSSRDC